MKAGVVDDNLTRSNNKGQNCFGVAYLDSHYLSSASLKMPEFTDIRYNENDLLNQVFIFPLE